ncbi:MAG: EAL domain-containing protein, partial [Thiotrichaceae bacterium]|nr:EAL domain-containing protein [Thiotrichaceae bacterium]
QITALKEQQRNRIEEGLNNGEFFLEYQPKVNMRTGKIYGFEALVRWHDPDTGIVYPDDFIPLCEDGELIVLIGDWVFNQALKQLQYWLKSGFDFHLAVNISAQQFQAPDFIEKLDRLLSDHPDIPANYIELEVLESAALQDTKKVSEIIVACHERNISIALDDFGSGYASLSYLKQLPANQLKIDKSFVLDMLSDEGDRAIIEGIISLAKIFNCQVVAEGVESGEHGVMLLRLGCDMAQGYGISKPLTAENVLGWAKTWQPDPNWLLWSETTWDISDFPLLIAHSDHLSGINNVIKSVELYNSESVLFDLLSYNHCRLGTWYYNIGKSKYQHLACYHDLEQPHKETHQLGKKLLQLCTDGKQSEALKMIPELIKLRDDVLIKLNALQQEILAQKK